MNYEASKVIDQSELYSKYELLPGTVCYTAVFGTLDDVREYSRDHSDEIILHVTDLESILGKAIVKTVVLCKSEMRLLVAVSRRMRSLLGRYYEPIEVRLDHLIADPGQTYYDGWYESNGLKIIKDE